MENMSRIVGWRECCSLAFVHVLCVLAMAGQVQPSFSCTTANSPSENLICADEELAAQERSMVNAYNSVLANLSDDRSKDFRKEHYEWFKAYKAKCDAAMSERDRKACIMLSLEEHTKQLNYRVEHPIADLFGPVTSSPKKEENASKVVETNRSAASKYIPPDFDKAGQYSTYTVDELYDALNDVVGINNDFVGKKVKVFAKYGWGFRSGDEARLRPLRGPIGGYGCYEALCDHLDPLTFLSVSKTLGNALTLREPLMMMFFGSDQFHQSLISASRTVCPSPMYPCLIWLKGRLGYAVVSYKSPLGAGKKRILYLETEEFRLYENQQNESLEALKIGAGFGSKVSDFLFSKPTNDSK